MKIQSTPDIETYWRYTHKNATFRIKIANTNTCKILVKQDVREILFIQSFHLVLKGVSKLPSSSNDYSLWILTITLIQITYYIFVLGYINEIGLYQGIIINLSPPWKTFGLPLLILESPVDSCLIRSDITLKMIALSHQSQSWYKPLERYRQHEMLYFLLRFLINCRNGGFLQE